MVIEPHTPPRIADDTRSIHDPLLAAVTGMDLPYLGYAGGVIQAAPDDLQTPNIEMWPLDQIYALRSDLIALSMMVDADDSAIQEAVEVGFRGILGSLHEAEDQEPLRLDQMHAGPRVRESRPSGSSSPLFGSVSFQLPRARSESERRMASTAHGRPRSSSQAPQLAQDSIWENVDMFMRPIEKMSAIHRVLGKVAVPADRSVLNEPMGPHYSTTIPKSQAVQSDPTKARLMIPQPPADLSGSADSSSYLHTRLISAVVPLLGCKADGIGFSGGVDIGQDTSQILRALRRAEASATPVSETCGFTMYNWLNFDERLSMELKSAGIEGKGSVIDPADCPILQDLADSFEKQEAVQAESAKWRRVVADLLRDGKEIVLEDRLKRHRQWSAVMSHYVAQEKPKGSLEKKKKIHTNASTESE
jgi:hypothetical protein